MANPHRAFRDLVDAHGRWRKERTMNSTNTVVANAMAARARNADNPHDIDAHGKKLVKGDRVKVVGAIGTYVVTKVDGEWIEIKDADDGTPQGRVEARFATPVKNACGTAKNAGRAYDVAAQAGDRFKDAYYALSGCEHYLQMLTNLGKPNDVPGNDDKIAAWAKDKLRKVSDLKNKLDQGRL